MVKAVALIRSVESVEKEAKGRAQLTLILRESKRKRKKKRVHWKTEKKRKEKDMPWNLRVKQRIYLGMPNCLTL